MDDNNSILTKEKYIEMLKDYDESDLIKEQRDAYRKAIVDILAATTVGEMVNIAFTVLEQNKQ